MNVLSALCCIMLLFCGAQIAFGMTSTNYQIPWDSLNEGGLDASTSTNYEMHSTIGEPFAGTGVSVSYGLAEGYRAGQEFARLSLTVKAQTSQAGVAYTALDTLGVISYVDVVSVATFSVGDYIAVVEDTGFSQLVVVGQITGISGLRLTVDRWDGNGGSMSGSPSGGNDVVYRLDDSAFSFGSLSAGTEHSSLVVSSVQTNVPAYTVYLNANQQLRNSGATHTITPVTDGTVTLGEEEYGAEAIGSHAVNQGVDVAVTTTMRAIQTRTVSSGASVDRVALLYKLSITSGTESGSYSQDVYYTLTKNY